MKSIVVAKASQTIVVGAVTGVVFGTAPITLSATATSGLSVSLSYVSGPGSLTGDVLTITGAGKIVVDATQAGSANYLAAKTVATSIAVAKEAQTITFPTIGSQTFPSSPITLGATASSGLTVTYTASGPATVSGNILTLKGAGTVVVKASQVGNVNYVAAPCFSVRQCNAVAVVFSTDSRDFLEPKLAGRANRARQIFYGRGVLETPGGNVCRGPGHLVRGYPGRRFGRSSCRLIGAKISWRARTRIRSR